MKTFDRDACVRALLPFAKSSLPGWAGVPALLSKLAPHPTVCQCGFEGFDCTYPDCGAFEGDGRGLVQSELFKASA